jgi:hypothetical protein
MSPTNPTSSTRSRRGLIAAAVIAPALAAGAIWLRSGDTIDTPAAPAPVQTSAASTAPAAPASQSNQAAEPTRDAMASKRSTSPASAPAPTMAPASAGQRAQIDPKTGRLRETEHDDVAAAGSAAPRRAARTATIQSESTPQEVLGPGGAIGIAVPEELHTAVVATRTPDGRIVLEHATGPKAAGAKVRKGAAKTSGVKEERNDR